MEIETYPKNSNKDIQKDPQKIQIVRPKYADDTILIFY